MNLNVKILVLRRPVKQDPDKSDLNITVGENTYDCRVEATTPKCDAPIILGVDNLPKDIIEKHYRLSADYGNNQALLTCKGNIY